jgi:hypothetical protein
VTVSLEVVVRAVTAKAVLVVVEDEEHWVPISCIDLDETDVELERGAKGTLGVSDWFAKKESLD